MTGTPDDESEQEPSLDRETLKDLEVPDGEDVVGGRPGNFSAKCNLSSPCATNWCGSETSCPDCGGE
jgi:hypothetical protein